MNIALLAPQKGGKTCYISALYGELSDLINTSKTQQPLSFYCTDTENRGFLIEKMDHLVEGVFPKPTIELLKYPIDVTLRDASKTVPIKIIDFPGGVIKDSWENVALIEEVREKLTTCDAFIILIDGDNASRQGLSFRRSIEATNISKLLLEVAESKRYSEYALHGVPFIFAISKVDLLSESQIKQAAESIEQTFEQFFTSNQCIAAITRLSIGTVTKAGEQEVLSYNPIDILEPFRLALGIGIMSGARYSASVLADLKYQGMVTAREKKDQYKHYIDAQDHLEKRKGKNFFDRVLDTWINGEPRTYKLEALRDKDKKHYDKQVEKHSNIKNNISLKMETLSILREIGVTILSQIDKDKLVTDEAMIIIKNGTRMTLADAFSHTDDDILVPLQ